MSDEEAHSGSRWEPQQPSAADQPTERHETPDGRSVAVAAAEHPATPPNGLPPTAPSARTGRGRRAILAAVGAGLLLVGGGAGYAIGHATATPTRAGAAFGHGHGGFRDGQSGGPGGTAGGPGPGPGGTAGGTGPGPGGTAGGTGTGGAAGAGVSGTGNFRRRQRGLVHVTTVIEASPTTRRPGVNAGAAGIDAAVRLAAAALVVGSVLVSTWLWISGGGVPDLGGWATGLMSLGRLSGLIASDLLVVQVLLMARIPVVERAVGRDRLVRQHRLVGFTSFTLMLVHVGLITWGYAAGRITGVPGTFWNLTVTYPGMLLALAGTLCLVMVVVTSIRAARARLRYESWHLLHLYAYLGVGLALPHQLWTGQEFRTSTQATVFWWTLWAAAAGAILIWRVGLPVLRSLRHRLRVTSVIAEDDDVVSVYVSGRRLDRLPVVSGQFLNWRFLSGPGWTRAHPYSLSAAPDGQSLRITVKALGDGSALARSIRPGTRVLVEGPYGRLTERPRTRAKVAFIGAGVGVTPLRALAEDLPYAPGDAMLLQRGLARPLFGRELAVLADERGLEVQWLPGHRRAADSWLGHGVPSGTDDLTLLRSWVPDIAERDVYVCGPQAWTDTVRATLVAAGLPAAQLHVETFAW